ncbi:MAG: PEGA domain-containing protein [Deltaproteobacteria bacterium]
MTPLLLLTLAAAPSLGVGVVPIRGDAAGTSRRAATIALEEALGDLPDLEVVSLSNLGELLGEDAARRLEACTDDACIRSATAKVKTDRLVVGTLDLEEQLVLRVRLIDTATSATGSRVRVSREIPPGGRGIAQAVSAVVADLFPERFARAKGLLVVSANLAGANVFVDGQLAGTTAANESGFMTVVRVKPGKRQIVVEARGHSPASATAEVLLGQRTAVAVELEKNRSVRPLILGGIGLAAVATGVIVGVTTKNTVDGWDAACGGGPCDEGFTRERYARDESAVGRGTLVTNGLLVAGAAAVIGAVVWYVLDPGEDLVVDGSGAVVGWTW